MNATHCPASAELKAYYLGLIGDEASDELSQHIANCPQCQSELDTVEDSQDSLVQYLRAADEHAEFDAEPACQLSLTKALGALASLSDEIARLPSQTSWEVLPRRIGEYEIMQLLGNGGMGHVYLAKHNKLGRLVALKVLAGHRLGDNRARQRFETEMRAVGGLSHPNIVIAHDAREIDGQAVLVTEYIDGLDLRQLVERTGPLPIADACEIVRQVAVALEYTSKAGFVHRDIKPSNIMLSRQGEVKLLDLGLARVPYENQDGPEVTCTGQTLGTADYISPEQVTDSRQVDVRSDIYSLGATFTKLLTGQAPFADDQHTTAFAKMTAHVSDVPPNVRSQRSDTPMEVDRLIASMLSKRPIDRPNHR